MLLAQRLSFNLQLPEHLGSSNILGYIRKKRSQAGGL